MSTEAAGIYDEWSNATGQMIAPSSMAVELVDWVLTAERARMSRGFRHVSITDREDLNRLGYELHPDGGYHLR